MVSPSAIHKVFVAGATGATGKHVVKELLDRGDSVVVAVARSKEKLLGLLDRTDDDKNLIIKEASVGSLTPDELKDLTKDCSAVVSCLGHNLTFQGFFRDGYFVSETAQKLTAAMPEKSRFVLMGTEGVAHPDGVTDPTLSRFERGVIWLLRKLCPPVEDNERAALHLYTQTQSHSSFVDWAVVRPGDLYNAGDEDAAYAKLSSGYKVMDHPAGAIFGSNYVSRNNVGHFIAELATMEDKKFQDTYNHKMPCIYQTEEVTEPLPLN